MVGARPNAGFTGIGALVTFPPVAGSDGERTVYRRRLGQNIAAFRTAFGEKQQELADYLGLEVETVGRWERGSREPKAYELHRIAERYGLDADWLLNPTDSLSERDARAASLRRVAAEAAQAFVAGEQDPPNGAGRSPRRGKARG